MTQGALSRPWMPEALMHVHVFKGVDFAWYGDGRPYPDVRHQKTLNDGTIREYAATLAVDRDVSQTWAEFGVQDGISANYFLTRLPATCDFYLFDAFKGLPEPWCNKAKGHRASQGVPVFTDPRVHIVEGWFADTLPFDPLLAFVHVDCDLYSSTKDVLAGINVCKGSLILFDEMFGYDGWQEHEYKALMEWGRVFRFIARDDRHRALIEVMA